MTGARDPWARAAAVLAAVGVAIAGYLTYVHYAGIDPVCTGGGGCERVQASRWSELLGIPVALLGLAFSAYLQYRALVSVDAACVWCLGSALAMALITVAATARFVLAAPEA